MTYGFLHHSSLCVCALDSSQDHAMVDLLAGLEDDGYRATPMRQNSQSQLQGGGACHYNSDEEEAEPELDREEAELSMVMSQRWDCDLPEQPSRTRFVLIFCSPVVNHHPGHYISVTFSHLAFSHLADALLVFFLLLIHLCVSWSVENMFSFVQYHCLSTESTCREHRPAAGR